MTLHSASPAPESPRELVDYNLFTSNHALVHALELFDRFGERRDEVEFHPAWHQLMRILVHEGLHTSPWAHPSPRGTRCARGGLHDVGRSGERHSMPGDHDVWRCARARAAGAGLRGLADPADNEARARHLTQSMALAVQASLLMRHGPAFVAEAFLASRVSTGAPAAFGTLPVGLICARSSTGRW
jgi:hypothetical protein